MKNNFLTNIEKIRFYNSIALYINKMALSSADNLCRTCLRQGGLLKSIFTIYEGFDVMISFADIINGYTTSLVQIAKEDGLPDMICSFCSNKVSEFYKFKTSIEKNEQILKSRSTNLNVTVKEEKLDFNDSFQESNVNCNKNVAENADETTIKQENLCKEEEEDNEYKIVNIDGLMHHDDVNSSNKEGQEDFLALQKMLNHEVKIDDPDENDYEMLSLDNSTTSFESDEEEAMQEVVNEASDTEDDLAEKNENGKPSRSKRKYASAFKKFQEWRNTENVDSLSEDVLLSYFNELTKTLKPNSLWTQYSMLRQTLIANYDVDISQYHKLRAGLKNKSQAYKPKKLKTLTMEEVDKFIKKAPDETYLFTKVALIIGVSGGCLRQELCQLKITDIEDLGSVALIKINDTKKKKIRTCTIKGDHYRCFKKYAQLRPPHITQQRFFLNYKDNKCNGFVVGVNRFGRLLKEVATYLKLENPELYTGHCYPRLKKKYWERSANSTA